MPLTEKGEKVQLKKEECKGQSTYTYTDILQKDICGKKVQDQLEKEN